MAIRIHVEASNVMLIAAALNPIWLISRRGFSKRRITAAAARNDIKFSIFLHLFFPVLEAFMLLQYTIL